MFTTLASHSTYASSPARAQVIAAWVQYVTDGTEVRAVISGECPGIEFDRQATLMMQRAAPTDHHPNRVCYARVPAGTKSIHLAGITLPVPVNTTPEHIIVMGDTGCRVSAKHGLYQACNNSSIWPFEKIAGSAATFSPELIIYTGDYIYRESPCPAGNKGCAGTPYGDNQATWEADWLLPSHPIRTAAPIVFLRGNHESCARAGNGWFRYLDPRPYTGQCQQTTAPWLMEAGSLRLVILDTSDLKGADKKTLSGLYAEQLVETDVLLEGPGWLVTHRPFWGFGADDDTGEPVKLTDVLQDAARRAGMPREVRLLIGAHLHLAEILGFGRQRPPQLIVGNSGTELVPETVPPEYIDGLKILNQRVFYQYGFVSMEPAAEKDWNIVFRDVEGRAIQRCLFSGGIVDCATH